MIVYQKITDSFKNDPRDICTVPLIKKVPLWFFVFVKDEKVWADTAKAHTNSSSIAKVRLLNESECDAMLDIYHRRQRGEEVSKEADEITRNQVYWYGIFSELGL